MKKSNFEFKDALIQIMSQQAKKQKGCLNIKSCCKTREGQSNFKLLPKDFYV